MFIKDASGNVVDDMDFPEDETKVNPFGETEEEPTATESIAQPGQVSEEGNADEGVTETVKYETSDTDNAEPEPDEVTNLRNQLNDAMGRLAEYERAMMTTKLHNVQNQPQEQTAQPQSQQPQPGIQLPKSPTEVTNVDFLGDGDHVRILEDREQFNQLLNRLVTVSMNASVAMAEERIMRQLPDIVQRSAQQQQNIHKITEDFYAANPDLVPYKQAVSMAAMQAYNEKPSSTLEEILSEAGTRTRKALQLTTTRKRVPAQPVGRGGGVDRTVAAPQLDSTEQQILELLNI